MGTFQRTVAGHFQTTHQVNHRIGGNHLAHLVVEVDGRGHRGGFHVYQHDVGGDGHSTRLPVGKVGEVDALHGRGLGCGGSAIADSVDCPHLDFVADPVGQARHGVAGGTRTTLHRHRGAPRSTGRPVAYTVAGNRGTAIVGRYPPHHRDGLAFDSRHHSSRCAGHPARRRGGLRSLAVADAVHRPHLESIQRAVGQTRDGDAPCASATADGRPIAPGLAGRGVTVLVTENLRAAVFGRAPTQSDALVTAGRRKSRRRTGGGFSQRGAGRSRLARSDGVHRPDLEFVGLCVLQIPNSGAGGSRAASNGRPFAVASADLLVADLVTEDRRSTVIGRCTPSQGHTLVAGFRRQAPGCARGALHRDGQSHGRTFETRVVTALHPMRQREGLFRVFAGVRGHVHRHRLVGVPVGRHEDQRRSGDRHAISRAIHRHCYGVQRLRSQADSVGPAGSGSNGQCSRTRRHAPLVVLLEGHFHGRNAHRLHSLSLRVGIFVFVRAARRVGQPYWDVLHGVVVFSQAHRHRLLPVPVAGGETQARPVHPDILGCTGNCHVYGRRRPRGQHHGVGVAAAFRDFQRRRIDGDTGVFAALDRQTNVRRSVSVVGCGVSQNRGIPGRDRRLGARVHGYRP